MIFDRTQNDVDTAILIRNTKVKKFEEMQILENISNINMEIDSLQNNINLLE